METILSKKNSLNLGDLKSILRNVAIIYSPVFLMFLDQIQKWEFDEKILIALAISTTLDIARRFIRELK